MKKRFLFLAVALLVAHLRAEPRNPNTAWFRAAGYGLFVHYLNELQNNPAALHSLGQSTSWNECVGAFDADRFAESVHQSGAGYAIFTTHQRTRFLIAPNRAFTEVTGYAPGEACSTRDLIADLATALARYNIPLMLYWTGNGPSADAQANARMGWKTPIDDRWLEKWCSVAEEYGLRYGEKIAGYWVDGCYQKHGGLNYQDAQLARLVRALKTGNPKRIVALNPGVELSAYSRHEDFTAGEQNSFALYPDSSALNGEQWHILSFLGQMRPDNYLAAGWGEPGVRYPAPELADYIDTVNAAGGVVSIDVMLYRDGSLDRSQLETLRRIRPLLQQLKNDAAQQTNNLAYRKPVRLLSHDGTREMPVHPGTYAARYGVDGHLHTAARACNAWDWAYEIDLQRSAAIREIHVTFGTTFATEARIDSSIDRATWTTLGRHTSSTNAPFHLTLPATPARWLRIVAEKPNAENQPGIQMSIAEVVVHE